MADMQDWIAAQRNRMQPPPLPPGATGELTNYNPSWRDRLADAMAATANAISGKPYDEARRDSMTLLGLAPVTGTAMATEDAVSAAKHGDYLGAGLAALGALPMAGEAKGAVAGAREALADTMSKAGRRQAITANSLRQLPLDEAIRQARTEAHIIPSPGTGQTSFVGAPYAATDRAAIDQLRSAFDADVKAGSAGADWYQRAQDWITRAGGPDPQAQSELARNLALFSAQADPSGNLGFSVKARNNAIMGMEPEGGVVRTGQQWNTYKNAFDQGTDIPLGRKTGVYADHMDPTRTSPTTGTNDIWHARALGYTEPEMQGGLSPQKHAWMDAETVLAVDRANQAAIGGRTDWTPGEVQAAPWVAGKGRGLAESRKGMSVDQGVAEAAKTYPDYAPAFTAYGTHEQVPGRSTDHLPSIANGDQATRDAFGGDWQDPQGRDTLYAAQGAYTEPSVAATGVYGDPVQFNPMQAARPLVAFSGPTGARVIDPASQQLMTGTEAFRAMMDAQDAGAWSIPLAGQKVGHNNAFELTVPGGTPSREALAEIMGIGQGQGAGDLVHYGGPRAVLTSFNPDAPLSGVGAKQAADMNAALGGRATATPTRLESGYVGYGDEWRGGAPAGEPAKQGSDMVTNEMLGRLNPAQEVALDKPEVRAKVLERFDRDAKVAAERGDVTREDLQRARKLFAEGGFKALRENLGKGLLPVAAAGLFLSQRSPDDAAQ